MDGYKVKVPSLRAIVSRKEWQIGPLSQPALLFLLKMSVVKNIIHQRSMLKLARVKSASKKYQPLKGKNILFDKLILLLKIE